MKISIKDELEEKEKAIKSLYAEKTQLEKRNQSLLSMYCFTLGIAYNEHPENQTIQKLIEGVFGRNNESGK